MQNTPRRDATIARTAAHTAFIAAPYRVYYFGGSIKTFQTAAEAIAFAADVEGTAYAGTAADMTDHTATELEV